MIEFLPLYLQGLAKMWPLWLILFLAMVWTSISERRDRLEEERVAKANKRDNPKRRNNQKHIV